MQANHAIGSDPTMLALSDVTEVATPAEITAGRLSDAKIELMAAHMRAHGFALLAGDVVPATTLDLLAPRFAFDAAYRYLDALDANGGDSVPCLGDSSIPGHGSARLPRAAPWVHRDIAANPLVEQVIAAVLGPRPYLNVYGGNLNFPGSGTQELHMDGVWYYASKEAAAAAGVGWPPPPHQVIAQICPTGSTIRGGATEVWPGSHLVTELASANKFVDGPGTRNRYAAAGEARISDHPPVRLEIPAGAVAFRDNRLFHRGVPNNGDEPRPMLALQYASRAVRNDLFANSTKLRSRLGPDQVPTDNHGNEVSHEVRKRSKVGAYSCRIIEVCQGMMDLTHRNIESWCVVFGQDRHVVFEESHACRSAFSDPSPFGVDRNVAFAPGPLDYDGKPGHLPTELPPVVPGVALPLWLRRYMDRIQAGRALL